MITSLVKTSIEEIHKAFIDAFSEYEVKMDLSLAKLEEMMLTRSYSRDDSLGYFKDYFLIGFLLAGKRIINGRKVLYDVATGVVQGHQGEGVGAALVEQVLETAGKAQADSFILEVLENNVAAQKLYTKYGFKIVRRLKCYEYSGDQTAALQKGQTNSGGDAFLPSDLDIDQYCSFRPSWQNSYTSFLNMRSNYHLHLEKEEDSIIGYGMVHLKNGSVLQLGLHPAYRCPELLQKIVSELGRHTESGVLKYLNVEENSLIEGHLIQLGFRNMINQYEMEYTFNH